VESGIRDTNDRCGRGVNWGDYNDDGWIDIFVSNYRLHPNLLWRNEWNGTFTNVAEGAGVEGENIGGSYGHTIGSQWADMDNDGDFDLFTANLAHPRFILFSDKSMLYINSGAPEYSFTDIRESAGITYYENHSDTAIADFNNDGFLDLFVTGIYVGARSFLYESNGDLTFTDVTYASGMRIDNGWGVAWADYDNDGDQDLVSRELYRNDSETGNWLQVRLIGVTANRAAIGARIVVQTGARQLTRQVEGGKGTTTQSSLTQHFGLGEATRANQLFIYWPTAPPVVDVYPNVQGNRIVTYVEGRGELLDGGVQPDGSTEPPPDDGGGCSCRTEGSGGLPLLWLLLVVLGLRRRRA
jgi:MYXO-CTERM domain-containing protein